MPLELQVRLLRVLETGRVKRVGGTKEIEVSVRVIAATNRPAEQALREGKLRTDLLHRLSVFPIIIPPLRKRPEDVDVLAQHFLDAVSQEEGKPKAMDPAILDALRAYHWPGNIRQLRNAVQRAYIVADDVLTVDCLPPEVRASSVSTQAPKSASPQNVQVEIGMTVADAERKLIEATIQDCDGDKRAAANLLGISVRTLYNRLREYGAVDAAEE
jgi:DNA-binding NtrC family response regulator